MYKKILLACFGIIVSLASRAQEFRFLPDETSQRLYSYTLIANLSYKPNNAYSDTMSVTQSVEYNELYPSGTSLFTVKSVQNYVFAGIKHDTATVTPAYNYKVSLSILCYSTSDSTSVATTKNVTLNISYDPDSGKSYVDANIFKFSGYHRVKVVVTDVTDAVTNTTILRSALPKNFYVMSTISTQRYEMPEFQILPWATAINGGKTLHVTWETSTDMSTGICTDNPADVREIKPIEYELEWQYIDNYKFGDPDGTFTGSSTLVPYNFRRNSTRVRLTELHFDIPLIYERGAIIYRIRALRPDYDNAFKTVLYGGWNRLDAGNADMTKACQAYFINTSHMDDSLNWQYSVNFAEQGKYKHVINYFDGSLRNRQTQTKINTDNDYVIAVDKTYDYEGRAAIQTLPVPIRRSALEYTDSLMINNATTVPYVAGDFDFIKCDKPDSIPLLDDDALAHVYYSPDNPDKTGHQKFVPDAKGFPFIQSVYSPDNLLQWQGGPGYENQLWEGHGTHYEYMRAMQPELTKLFPGEAGNFRHYPKQVITDPNGQTSFLIQNHRGQTIATGLIGEPDTIVSPIDRLPNYDTGFAECVTIFFNDQEKTSTSLSVSTPFYGEKQGPYSLQYSVNIWRAFTPPGCSGKYLHGKGYYSYSLTDDCGRPVMPEVTGTFDSNEVLLEDQGQGYAGPTETQSLPKGKYLINKTLSFSRPEINQLIRGFVKDNEPDCYDDEKYFVRLSVDSADFPCVNSTYIDTSSPCGRLKKKMMADLTPGGRYAKYCSMANLGNVPDLSSLLCLDRRDSNSIFRPLCYNLLPDEFSDPSVGFPTGVPDTCEIEGFSFVMSGSGGNCGCDTIAFPYQKKCLNLPDVTKNGTLYTNIETLPLDTFIYIFNDEVAEALLPLHPDYCALLNCLDDEAPIEKIGTYRQAEFNNMFLLDSIIVRDSIYTQATPGAARDAIKQKLSYISIYPVRIDTLALRYAYCDAGNMEEHLHAAKFIYKDSIANFRFVNDEVKQKYFQLLKGFYLGNRAAIITADKDLYDTVSVTKVFHGDCAACGHGYLDETGHSVFRDNDDPVPDISHNPYADYMAVLDTMDGIDEWVKELFAEANDPEADPATFATRPPQLQDSLDKWKAEEIKGMVDYIMEKLVNCSLDTNVLNDIREDVADTVAKYGVDRLTPVIIKGIITTHASLNDLCHPFLVGYETFDFSFTRKHPYLCAKTEVYYGIKDFLNRTGVETAMRTATVALPSTIQSFALSADNRYENKIAAKWGASTTETVYVRGLIDTMRYELPGDDTARFFVHLKIWKNSTPSKDTINLYLKRRSDTSARIDTAAVSINVDDAFCLNEDPEAATDGYVARSTAVLDITVNGDGKRHRYYIWSNLLNIMEPTSENDLSGAITCVDIRNALTTFDKERGTYSYDPAFNHPLYATTLTNYLNYKLHKQHSFVEYYDLMRGCAVTDKVVIKRHFSTIEAIRENVDTTDFLDKLRAFTERNVIELRLRYADGKTYFYVDLNGLPYDSLLRFKDTIMKMAPGTSTYLPDKPLMIFDRDDCIPDSILSYFVTPTTSTPTNVYFNDSSYPYTEYKYLVGCIPGAKNYSNSVLRAQQYANQCTGSFVIPDIEILRSTDYHTADKQAYLSYVYRLSGTGTENLADSLSPSNLRNRITLFGGKTLSYKGAYCDKNKTDLFIYDNMLNHWGESMLDDILNKVDDALGTTGKMFMNEGVLETSGVTGLKIFRKANGVHWYRWFAADNTMYNAYIEPPANPLLEINMLRLDSFHVGPGLDSITRFTAYMHYAGEDPEVVECRGYTDFPIGYGRKVANVILHTVPGLNNCLDTFDCEYRNLLDAVWAGKLRYMQYFDSNTTHLTELMLAYLIDSALDGIEICGQAQKNHITRYYHDLAGNLVRTVPPASGADPYEVSMPSHYRYDSRNLLVLQQTPDGGTTRFFYDLLGRPVFSQNARQITDTAYSYTLYDGQGRIVETGEAKFDCGYDCDYVINTHEYTPADIEYNVRNHSRKDVVRTLYDQPFAALDAVPGYNLSPQENLINRVSAILYYKSKDPDYGDPFLDPDYGTYYSYDMVGNVKTITYQHKALANVRQVYKRVDYDYDQVSGKVNMLSYNRGRADQFYHKYDYDADNRIIRAYTSSDGIIWNRDAEYDYYKHGPLANMRLGDDQIQSIDYAYTIQGWLKAMNGDVLNPDYDMGHDGDTGDRSYARDVIALSLDYYTGDYKPIGSTQVTRLAGPEKSLYNGNIAGQTMSVNRAGSLQRTYRYDQVQRLKLATYATVNEADLSIASPSNIFKNSYTYDGPGNIQTLTRYDDAGNLMDHLSYEYYTNSNRLKMVQDGAGGGTPAPHDFDTVSLALNPNYLYDSLGNLIRDKTNHQKIRWNSMGKVSEIEDTVLNEIVRYDYDGLGNRVRKDVIDTVDANEIAHRGEIYVRDASGNLLATYAFRAVYDADTVIEDTLQLAEHHLYGSSKLGTRYYGYDSLTANTFAIEDDSVNGLGLTMPWYSRALEDIIVAGQTEPWSHAHTDSLRVWRTIGRKHYDITDHLGNIVAEAKDRKTGHKANPTDTIYSYWKPDLAEVSDYYPFGMKMPGRMYTDGGYSKYGYNGQPAEQDMYKSKPGNLGKYNVHTTYKFREYDTRFGRFWSVDPYTAKFPMLSPYQFASLNPIKYVDLDGLEGADIKYESVYSSMFVGGEGMSDEDKEVYSEAYDAIVEPAATAVMGEFAAAQVFRVAGATFKAFKAAKAPAAAATVVKTEGQAATKINKADDVAEKVDDAADAGTRTKNRLPDTGEPNTVQTNAPGTTSKKYGPDGKVQKEFNKGHQGNKTPPNERADHVHDYKPNPRNPSGRGDRQPGRPPKKGEIHRDFTPTPPKHQN